MIDSLLSVVDKTRGIPSGISIAIEIFLVVAEFSLLSLNFSSFVMYNQDLAPMIVLNLTWLPVMYEYLSHVRIDALVYPNIKSK